MIKSGNKFAHVLIAGLLWHVQNYDQWDHANLNNCQN